MTYQLRIQLKNVVKPPVWRQILVSEMITFNELHRIIQSAFGWGDFHLYQFSPSGYGSNPVIAIPSKEDWEKPDMDARKTKLKAVFTFEKQTFNYVYDFGDDWSHKITVEKVLPGKIESPVCLAGKGACPPEDCGGAWGYESLKIIMADPQHEEYQDMKEWLDLGEDEDWDANYFELEEINNEFKDYK